MTRPSYTTLAETFKPSKTSRDNIGKFEVHAGGMIYPCEDIVSGSVCCHERCGKLFSVVRDDIAPHGFRRIPEAPLAEDIARDCAKRTPRKNDPAPMPCISIWR